MATTLDEVRQELGMAEARVIDARRSMDSIEATLRGLIETVPLAYPLPAPALTEQAIVDALKADPNLMARVIVGVSRRICGEERSIIRQAANHACEKSPDPTVSRVALQSLAVALAAASYRG